MLSTFPQCGPKSSLWSLLHVCGAVAAHPCTYHAYLDR